MGQECSVGLALTPGLHQYSSAKETIFCWLLKGERHSKGCNSRFLYLSNEQRNVCNVCNQLLLEHYMVTGNFRYHPQCFRCCLCQVSMGEGQMCALVNGAFLYCGPCFRTETVKSIPPTKSTSCTVQKTNQMLRTPKNTNSLPRAVQIPSTKPTPCEAALKIPVPCGPLATKTMSVPVRVPIPTINSISCSILTPKHNLPPCRLLIPPTKSIHCSDRAAQTKFPPYRLPIQQTKTLSFTVTVPQTTPVSCLAHKVLPRVTSTAHSDAYSPAAQPDSATRPPVQPGSGRSSPCLEQRPCPHKRQQDRLLEQQSDLSSRKLQRLSWKSVTFVGSHTSGREETSTREDECSVNEQQRVPRLKLLCGFPEADVSNCQNPIDSELQITPRDRGSLRAPSNLSSQEVSLCSSSVADDSRSNVTSTLLSSGSIVLSPVTDTVAACSDPSLEDTARSRGCSSRPRPAAANIGLFKHRRSKSVPESSSWWQPAAEHVRKFPLAQSSSFCCVPRNYAALRDSDVTYGELLGQGFYGRAIKVTHRVSGEEMAVKELFSLTEEAQNCLLREASILRCLSHPCVLQFTAILVRNNYFSLVTEFIEGGTLCDLLLNQQVQLSWPQRISMARDMAAGMSYLHSVGILHRDLNSQNCLVRKNLKVVVADFGLAKVVPSRPQRASKIQTGSTQRRGSCRGYAGTIKGRFPDRKRGTIVGNPFWMAPEMLNKEAYDWKVDVFSYGMVVCETIARVTADPDYLPRSLDFGLNVEAFYRRFCTDCPEPYVMLAVQCSQTEPHIRPNFDEIYSLCQSLLYHLEFGVAVPVCLRGRAVDYYHERKDKLYGRHFQKLDSCIQSG